MAAAATWPPETGPQGRVLVLQHARDTPAGLLAEWAESRELDLELHRTDEDPALPEPDERPFVCCLGSINSPLDTGVPAVAATLDLVGRAVQSGIPVLGLCYGGQVLADVMGGTIEDAPEPEIGWHTIESDAPDLVAPGPWLQWHYQRFTLPPGAKQLASSRAGVQAFSSGPHLGVQFHPESTIEIVKRWASLDIERLTALGMADTAESLEAWRAGAGAARSHAFQLFDGFWERARRAGSAGQ